MTLKTEDGKIDWKAIVAFLSIAVALVTIIAYTSGFQSKISKVDELNAALMESKNDRNAMHIQIATLQECARNTEVKLSTIEAKLDRILERNARIDYRTK
jgi:Tfp pilus assembly protein PilO